MLLYVKYYTLTYCACCFSVFVNMKKNSFLFFIIMYLSLPVRSAMTIVFLFFALCFCISEIIRVFLYLYNCIFNIDYE